MSAAIPLRGNFSADDLRRLAKSSRDASQSRRLLALVEIYDGGSRTDAARIGTVGLQTMRDWGLAFNARGSDGLIDDKAPGQAPKLIPELGKGAGLLLPRCNAPAMTAYLEEISLAVD